MIQFERYEFTHCRANINDNNARVYSHMYIKELNLAKALATFYMHALTVRLRGVAYATGWYLVE